MLTLVPGEVVATKSLKEKAGTKGKIWCAFNGFPLSQINWQKDNDSSSNDLLRLV